MSDEQNILNPPEPGGGCWVVMVAALVVVGWRTGSSIDRQQMQQPKCLPYGI